MDLIILPFIKHTYLLLSIYDNCDQTICLEPVITVKQKNSKEKNIYFLWAYQNIYITSFQALLLS